MSVSDELLLEFLRRIEKKQDDIDRKQDETLSAVTTVAGRVTIVETQIEPLFDNGQPGIISTLKSEVRSLQNSRTWIVGVIAGLEFAGHWIAHKAGLK